MSDVVRFTALYAEEDPDGTLIGADAIKDLEVEIEELHRQGEELYEAAERLARACESTKQGKRVTAAIENFREVTGG